MKDCNQCGKCCIKYGGGDLSATLEEINMWEIFQPHIYQYVRDEKIWFSPETDEPLQQCPFLEVELSTNKPSKQKKYTCSIYHDRPEDCRHYPTTISEMVRDECEMIELIDLDDYKRAQKKLDALMVDSRPAME
ncbi:MAG: Fe-S-cluster containining protein [Pseudohongiellaceae bacterium]|jgi:Fe-S-cluster containining protein